MSASKYKNIPFSYYLNTLLLNDSVNSGCNCFNLCMYVNYSETLLQHFWKHLTIGHIRQQSVLKG